MTEVHVRAPKVRVLTWAEHDNPDLGEAVNIHRSLGHEVLGLRGTGGTETDPEVIPLASPKHRRHQPLTLLLHIEENTEQRREGMWLP